MRRLKEYYKNTILPNFIKDDIFFNKMAVPRIVKIIVNVGFGNISGNKKLMDSILKDIMMITGQKPIITKAVSSIAGFKIRRGFPVGCKVTLRKDRMYDFFDKLLSVTLPTIRDFRGISAKSFDGNGNFNFGIKEHIVFPEIEYDKIESIIGMNITIVTSAKNDKDGMLLFKAFGFPFF